MKTLNELGAKDCRWPIGDPKSPDFGFCAERQEKGQPYCAEHKAVAYRGRGRSEKSNG